MRARIWKKSKSNAFTRAWDLARYHPYRYAPDRIRECIPPSPGMMATRTCARHGAERARHAAVGRGRRDDGVHERAHTRRRHEHDRRRHEQKLTRRQLRGRAAFDTSTRRSGRAMRATAHSTLHRAQRPRAYGNAYRHARGRTCAAVVRPRSPPSTPTASAACAYSAGRAGRPAATARSIASTEASPPLLVGPIANATATATAAPACCPASAAAMVVRSTPTLRNCSVAQRLAPQLHYSRCRRGPPRQQPAPALPGPGCLSCSLAVAAGRLCASSRALIIFVKRIMVLWYPGTSGAPTDRLSCAADRTTLAARRVELDSSEVPDCAYVAVVEAAAK